MRCRCRQRQFPSKPDLNHCKIPLIASAMNVKVQNSLSTIVLTQTFFNAEPHPIECEYSFPISDQSVITSLKFVYQDGTILIPTIEEDEKAAEMYQDGISDGHMASLSKFENSSKTNTIIIGNLPRNHTVNVEFTIAAAVGTEESSWKFQSPIGYIPISETKKPNFEFLIEIIQDFEISSYSSNYPLVWTTENKKILIGNFGFESKSVHEDVIWVKFRTESTNFPSCILQKANGKCAAMMSFIPYSLEDISLDLEGTGEFLFVLDRSGSMSGERISLVKRAAIFFLKSLPIGSFFNIISFGSSFKFLFPVPQKVEGSTVEYAIGKIENFKANLGGTDIFSPIQAILSSPAGFEYPRTIFLLTDGEVSDSDSVINLIRLQAGVCRVHGFGIGDGVDRSLINNSAKAGRGCAYFIENIEELGKKVINALKMSVLPCMNNWNIDWPGESYPSIDKIGTVYYGEKCVQYILFNELPKSLPVVRCYDSFSKDFKEFQIKALQEIPGEEVFKLWAGHKINYLSENIEENRSALVQLSKEFGIPSDITSFICIHELENPVFEEMQTRKLQVQPKKKSRSRSRSLTRGSPNNLTGGGRGGSRGRGRGSSALTSQSFPTVGLNFLIFKSSIEKPSKAMKSKKSKKNAGIDSSPLEVYMKIILSQTDEGCWTLGEIEKILPEIHNLPKDLMIGINLDTAISTLYVLCYLYKYHIFQHDEWVLIERKATKWLNSKNISFLDYQSIISSSFQ